MTMTIKKKKGWDYRPEHEAAGESITKTIIITLGAAAAYILLSVGLLIWCRMKRRQRKLRSPDGLTGAVVTTEVAPNAQTALRNLSVFFFGLKSSLSNEMKSVGKDAQVEAGLNRPSGTGDKLSVPAASVTKGNLLGKGRFGDVLEGFVSGTAGIQGAEGSTGGTSRVLLRVLSSRDEEVIHEFRRQGKRISTLFCVTQSSQNGLNRFSRHAPPCAAPQLGGRAGLLPRLAVICQRHNGPTSLNGTGLSCS